MQWSSDEPCKLTRIIAKQQRQAACVVCGRSAISLVPGARPIEDYHGHERQATRHQRRRRLLC